jgi:hypothetical protein
MKELVLVAENYIERKYLLMITSLIKEILYEI